MSRLAALLLCALVTAGMTAAPAPFPKPWITGWYKPLGEGRFDRKGDKLTGLNQAGLIRTEPAGSNQRSKPS
jgi:hypothetical protein